MINSVSFKNYKAFSDGELELKPITILLGANSSGKSSLLQLFLLVEQTVNNPEAYQSALKLNGRYINLGEDENLIKDKNIENTLCIEFNFNAVGYSQKLQAVLRLVDSQLVQIGKTIEQIKTKGDDDSLFRQMLSNKKYIDLFNEVQSIEYKHNSIESDDFKFKDSSLFFDYIVNQQFLLFAESSDRKMDINERLKIYKDLFEILEPLKNIYSEYGVLGYNLRYNSHTKKLEISDHYVKIDNLVLLKLTKTEVFSEILNNDILKKYSKEILSQIKYDALKIEEPITKIIPKNIAQLFNDAYSVVSETFDSQNINYVSPLRAHPQRYYLLDEANINTSLNTQSGTNLAEILKKNSSINSRVNTWMKKFGLKVTVKEFKDIIHNIKINQNNLDLDITDVGFGISQVLPILVQGFMSTNKSLTIIEQPEIHLHPKMQADLADLFIDIIKLSMDKKGKTKKSLLIETHSEYILKRLRRRISEGKLNSRDIAIYFIEPRNEVNKDSAIIRRIKISKDGSFDWPQDFYLTEFEDDMAYFQNLAKKNSKKK